MMLEAFINEVLPLKNKLYRFAFSILGDYDISKDVVQETMLKVWEKRSDLNKIKNLEAWCMTLTRNYALDKIRSKHHKTTSLREDYTVNYNDLTPHRITELDDAMEIIELVIKKLPLKQKETFQLRDIEGYSYQEISDITGYNLNDVKINIFRARNTIRTTLLKLQTHGLEKSRSTS